MGLQTKGLGTQTEGRQRGAIARLLFNLPYPIGPEFIASYRADGDSGITGTMHCRFLSAVSSGGMVEAHVWVNGRSDPNFFQKGKIFELKTETTILAKGEMERPPPDPTYSHPPDTSGLPWY